MTSLAIRFMNFTANKPAHTMKVTRFFAHTNIMETIITSARKTQTGRLVTATMTLFRLACFTRCAGFISTRARRLRQTISKSFIQPPKTPIIMTVRTPSRLTKSILISLTQPRATRKLSLKKWRILTLLQR